MLLKGDISDAIKALTVLGGSPDGVYCSARPKAFTKSITK
jgi:hypothetical protein